jgi:hypothetical protein
MNTRFAGVLFTLIYVTGLAIGAHAQEREDTVIVRVPYDFVVDGSALRRGEYRVSRIDTARGARQLEISSLDTGASILFIPTVFDDFTTGHPQLSFEQVGGRYCLTAIKTPIGTYAIPIPQSAITFAKAKDHSTITSAGTN